MTVANVLMFVDSVLIELIVAIFLTIMLKHIQQMLKYIFVLKLLRYQLSNVNLHSLNIENGADMIVIRIITTIEHLSTRTNG